MFSAATPTPTPTAVGSDAGPGAPAAPDGRERILVAALDRFAADGVTGTSVRAIAAAAGVSAPLVLHHFGSKDGLVAACDDHLADTIRALKTDALTSGAALDPVAALAAAGGTVVPLLRYLARRLVDGGPAVDELVDRIVDDAHAYVRAGIAHGALRPSEQERERTTVLALWSLGAVALHEHARRLLGFSVIDGPEGVAQWGRIAAEVLTAGIVVTDVDVDRRDEA